MNSTQKNLDVLQDRMAISLAHVLEQANKCATQSGVDVSQCIITITRRFDGGEIWRINYGLNRSARQRGGDFIIDVKADDASILQILRGQ